MTDADALRLPGTISRECSHCHWQTLGVDPLSVDPSEAYVCDACRNDKPISTRCDACHRCVKTTHLAILAERNLRGGAFHCKACIDVPTGEHARNAVCWSCVGLGDGPEVPATQTVLWIDGACGCGCGAPEKRKPYRVCDACAADWLQDKPDSVQKDMMRRRGAIIIELPDGWTFRWPKQTTS